MPGLQWTRKHSAPCTSNDQVSEWHWEAIHQASSLSSAGSEGEFEAELDGDCDGDLDLDRDRERFGDSPSVPAPVAPVTRRPTGIEGRFEEVDFLTVSCVSWTRRGMSKGRPGRL